MAHTRWKMTQYRNTLLSKFDQETIERLNLHPVQFEVGHEIETPGNPIANLFFVEEGMASMTTIFADGSQVEVGMFGYESVIGVSALMGSRRSLNRVYTQIAGSGYCCDVERGRAEFRLCGFFQTLTLRYVQAQLLQVAQSAGCNMTHNVDQRLARWLLICSDKAHTATFRMSHNLLGHMLGVRRPTVSLTAESLRKSQLIDYRYSTITILDRAGLIERACECYLTIKDHLDNYAEFAGGVE